MKVSYEEIASQLQSEIEQLEALQSKCKKMYLICAIGIVLSILVSVVLFSAGNDPLLIAGAFVLVGGIAAGVYFMNQPRKRLRTQFKSTVIPAFLEKFSEQNADGDSSEIESQWGYNPDERLNDHYIHECGLFPSRISSIHGGDLTYGQLGSSEFYFSKLKLSRLRVSQGSQGQRFRRRETLFKGVLFLVDLNLELEGRTLMLKRSLLGGGRVIGDMLDSLLSGDEMYAVELGNERFDQLFDVRTTDEAETRYLISPKLMEQIVQFRDKHKEKIEMSFFDRYVAIALSTKRNYFEPSLLGPVKPEVRRVYDDLTFLLGMIESFNLNVDDDGAQAELNEGVVDYEGEELVAQGD